MKRILISRTDSIGDVILTLPMVGVVKHHYPDAEIVFLANTYTRPIVQLSSNVNEILEWDQLSKKRKEDQIAIIKALNADAILHVFPRKEIADLAKSVRIPLRVGTSHRLFHLLTCNKRINFTRRRSGLHESQLNLKLLRGIRIQAKYLKEELVDFYNIVNVPEFKSELIEPTKFNLIIHPKSKGSAVEWGMDNFVKLIDLLPQENFNIFITGTKEEGDMVTSQIPKLNHVHDLTGKLTLSELVGFINQCDGLLAASTGPLHIASMLGINALGIYSPQRPIHPDRWMPIGEKVTVFVKEIEGEKHYKGGACPYILQITPEEIADHLIQLAKP